MLIEIKGKSCENVTLIFNLMLELYFHHLKVVPLKIFQTLELRQIEPLQIDLLNHILNLIFYKSFHYFEQALSEIVTS